MNDQKKTKKDLIKELEALQQENSSLKAFSDKYKTGDRQTKQEKGVVSRQLVKDELLKLEMAIYNSQEVIFMTDKEGLISYINPEFTKMYGYTAEEVIGKTTPRILNKGVSDKKYFTLFWDTLMNKKSVSKTEYSNKCKDGTFVEIEGSADPILNYNGDIIGFLGIQRDISERKRLELEKQVMNEITHSVSITNNLNELLKLIHQSLRKVLFSENIFIALYDPDTNLFSFPYFVDQYDPAPEPTAMRKSCTAYVFRTGQPVLITPELFKQLKDQNEVELVGSPSPSWIGVPLQTPGKTIGVLVLQHYEKEKVYSERDIKFLATIGTQAAFIIERRLAAEELRESETRLNVILESTADGILAIDSRGKIIKTNRRFNEMWQIQQPLIEYGDDKALLDYVQEQLTNPDEFISKVQKLYNSLDEDFDYLHFKDGRIFGRFSAPLLMHNSSIGRVWSFRDITSARRAEEEIKKQNEDLSRANAEKDKFFSIIVHDLRSPFSGFLGLTKIMAEELSSLTMAQVQDIAERMRSSAANLFRLLNNLLEWSQIQKGLIPFKPEAVQLTTIVDESMVMIMESAKNKGIEITLDIPDDLEVFADTNMLQSVIRNLASNALKFTPRGGKISVSAKIDGNNNTEVSILDTGIGMSQSILNSLFRLDVQTNRTGTEDEPSTGLGLLLCYEFIEKHGGKIWAQSEEGKGSIFHFIISCPTR